MFLPMLSENAAKVSFKKHTNNFVFSFLISSNKLEMYVAKGC